MDAMLRPPLSELEPAGGSPSALSKPGRVKQLRQQFEQRAPEATPRPRKTPGRRLISSPRAFTVSKPLNPPPKADDDDSGRGHDLAPPPPLRPPFSEQGDKENTTPNPPPPSALPPPPPPPASLDDSISQYGFGPDFFIPGGHQSAQPSPHFPPPHGGSMRREGALAARPPPAKAGRTATPTRTPAGRAAAAAAASTGKAATPKQPGVTPARAATPKTPQHASITPATPMTGLPTGEVSATVVLRRNRRRQWEQIQQLRAKSCHLSRSIADLMQLVPESQPERLQVEEWLKRTTRVSALLDLALVSPAPALPDWDETAIAAASATAPAVEGSSQAPDADAACIKVNAEDDAAAAAAATAAAPAEAEAAAATELKPDATQLKSITSELHGQLTVFAENVLQLQEELNTLHTEIIEFKRKKLPLLSRLWKNCKSAFGKKKSANTNVVDRRPVLQKTPSDILANIERFLREIFICVEGNMVKGIYREEPRLKGRVFDVYETLRTGKALAVAPAPGVVLALCLAAKRMVKESQGRIRLGTISSILAVPAELRVGIACHVYKSLSPAAQMVLEHLSRIYKLHQPAHDWLTWDYLATCWCWSLFDVEEVQRNLELPERMKAAFQALISAAEQHAAIRQALS